MAEGDAQDVVSREAHDRVKQERDQLKAQAEQAAAAAKAALLVDKAYAALKGKVPDPYAAAKAVSRDPQFSTVDDDELPQRLDQWVAEWKSLFGSDTSGNTQTSDSGQKEVDVAEPPTPVAPPPGAARSAPSPANTGGQPTPEPLTFSSPEVRKLREQGRIDEIRQMLRDGRLVPSPGNPYAHLAKT